MMSKFKTVRTGLLGSAAALALVGAATTAQDVEAQFGDVSIVFDTTVSIGGAVRTTSRNRGFLSEGNGGPIDPRDSVALGATFGDPDAGGPAPTFVPGTFLGTAFVGPTPTGFLTITTNKDNFDGSVNADDGRLNFDKGDAIGGNVKASHELVVKWENYTLFARGFGFYDVVLNDRDAGERSDLADQALGDVGRNYELLDLFVSADYTIADLPINLRVGKQVINWGESTFIQNGNNIFNPIDVGAIRRPGAEIKEALVPVNAVSASISLPYNVSFSAYYALDWEPFELDPSGTPFSGADVVELGSGVGGNVGAIAFTGGSPLGGMRRNCDANTSLAGIQQTNAVLKGILPSSIGVLGDGVVNCSDQSALVTPSGGIFASSINYKTFYRIGRHEEVKIGLPSILAADQFTRPMQGIFERVGNVHASDDGQFGLSAHYLADWAGNTEFGLYYQNYHSRLPFVNVTRLGLAHVGFATVGDSVSLGGLGNRGLNALGCGLAVGMNEAAAGAAITGASAFVPNTIAVADPMDLVNAAVGVTISGLTGAALVLTPGATSSGVTIDTVQNVFKVNCMAQFYQNLAFGPSLLQQNGQEGIGLNPQYGLTLEYPEDIGIVGASFSTTLWGWGVQGEMTLRPDAPFQVDSDTLTIWNAISDCVIRAGAGGVELVVLAGRENADGTGAPSCGNTRRSNPVIKNQMVTAQIGTTASFTGSSWFNEQIGSDGSVLVTELGMVHVPGVEDTYLDKFSTANKKGVQYQGLSCQGSDLGLGGLIGLDAKSSKKCRPNSTSAGLVMLMRWDYNNAFDTGFLVQPQISYSYDFYGSTPAPYGNYLEDRQALNLAVTGTLNNNFRIGASYTNFFGANILNKASDQDFGSLTASYTF